MTFFQRILRSIFLSGLIFGGMLMLCGMAAGGVKDDGYRGIWFTLGQKSEFGDKYSGGLGTYTVHHIPMAVYSPEAKKTFFVYGGAKGGERHLLAMASYYDHEKRVVPRPTTVHDKQTVNDPHDNPSINIDEKGYLWVFVSGRGQRREGFIYRSTRPFSVEDFELKWKGEMTYPQPWWIKDEGFLFLFTKYTKGRELYFRTGKDGEHWSDDVKFAGMGGHYQTSFQDGRRIITAFNMHPGGDVDKRTNLYFLQTDDLGKTWRNIQGEAVKLPLAKSHNRALVRDYRAEKRLVYIDDLGLDREGRPVLLYNTSSSSKPGPPGDPRWMTVAHWTGKDWKYSEISRAPHNYSFGSIYIEGDLWRIIAPTEPGPQPLGTGGEIAVWLSRDQGETWTKDHDLTRKSPMNHGYVRRPLNANPDFYGFWADGNPDEFSKSYLYFTNQAGDRVWQLPYDMKGEFAEPKLMEWK